MPDRSRRPSIRGGRDKRLPGRLARRVPCPVVNRPTTTSLRRAGVGRCTGRRGRASGWRGGGCGDAMRTTSWSAARRASARAHPRAAAVRRSRARRDRPARRPVRRRVRVRRHGGRASLTPTCARRCSTTSWRAGHDSAVGIPGGRSAGPGSRRARAAGGRRAAGRSAPGSAGTVRVAMTATAGSPDGATVSATIDLYEVGAAYVRPQDCSGRAGARHALLRLVRPRSPRSLLNRPMAMAANNSKPYQLAR